MTSIYWSTGSQVCFHWSLWVCDNSKAQTVTDYPCLDVFRDKWSILIKWSKFCYVHRFVYSSVQDDEKTAEWVSIKLNRSTRNKSRKNPFSLINMAFFCTLMRKGGCTIWCNLMWNIGPWMKYTLYCFISYLLSGFFFKPDIWLSRIALIRTNTEWWQQLITKTNIKIPITPQSEILTTSR